MTIEQLAKWGAQEIKELDELCRSMIPGYEPLDSREMAFLKQLRAVGEGAADPGPNFEKMYNDLLDRYNDMEAALQHIAALAGEV